MEFVLIAILGLVMGIVTSISGGAGIFAVPTMLAFGLPPINVLALNRTSDLGVVFGALKGYLKSKTIDWKLAFIILVPFCLGSFIAANIVVRMSDAFLRGMIVFGAIVGMILILKPLKPRTGLSKGKISWLGLFCMFLVGLWDGSIAIAGTTFAVLILVHFANKDFLEARSTDLIPAIPETIITATILILNSNVSVWILLTMFVSSFVGAWIGAHLAVKHGSGLIKKAMVFIAILMIAKIVFGF